VKESFGGGSQALERHYCAQLLRYYHADEPDQRDTDPAPNLPIRLSDHAGAGQRDNCAHLTRNDALLRPRYQAGSLLRFAVSQRRRPSR